MVSLVSTACSWRVLIVHFWRLNGEPLCRCAILTVHAPLHARNFCLKIARSPNNTHSSGARGTCLMCWVVSHYYTVFEAPCTCDRTSHSTDVSSSTHFAFVVVARLWCFAAQLGKSRTCQDLLEGWIIEGNEYQPGLLEMLKAARTPEVRACCALRA